jgi:RNA polymerase primary sigma factor
MQSVDYLTQNAGLVHLHARRFVWACGGCLGYEDLVQAGNIGLMEAAQRFDASRGVKFSSYAALLIRTRIKDEVENQSRTISLPRCYRRKMWKQGTRVSQHGKSLDSGGEQAANIMDSMAHDDAPDSALESRERDAMASRIRQFIERRFGERDKQILLAFFDGTKQADIARAVGLSRERVRQVCTRGVQRIKEHVARMTPRPRTRSAMVDRPRTTRSPTP